ncbi:MAG: HNH endonuclease [Planctomycetes bacterium]|nr:HNH endonuclease [Planctomycetota bacterium]
MPHHNQDIRLAALAHCRQLTDIWERAVPASELKKGFSWRSEQVQLMGQQGIFKPRQMDEEPLTLKSTLASRYEDEEIEAEDMILYDYAPTTREYENRWTRSLVGKPVPVIYLKQVAEDPSEYLVIAPVFIVGDDPTKRKFALSTVAGREALPNTALPLLRPDPVRGYAERTLKQRLHQAHFRKNVISAYRTRCAICELRIRNLLDGAHILPDSHARGEPKVSNGMSMCALHHRAFDRKILDVTPDYVVKVGEVVISEHDLAAILNIREYEGKRILIPRDPREHPDPELLRLRLEVAS